MALLFAFLFYKIFTPIEISDIDRDLNFEISGQHVFPVKRKEITRILNRNKIISKSRSDIQPRDIITSVISGADQQTFFTMDQLRLFNNWLIAVDEMP